MADLVVERHVAAPPESVYLYLTDSARWSRWQGVDATIEARPGGLFRMAMATGLTARGQFIDLEQDRRIVFSWGWIDHPGLPPGSSTVEIELIPTEDGTLIKLTHHGLPPDEVDLHRHGWERYLPRLGQAASGLDPGPDDGG